MTEPNLYNVGYDVGFEDGFKEAQGQVRELEAKLAKAVEALEFYGTEAHYTGEYFADPCGCCGSWYEPRIHKDGEDSGGLARTTLAALSETHKLKGDSDD